MSEVSKKALPFEVTKGFTPIPSAVLLHYSYYPKFNGNHVRLYAYLLRMHNEKYGYAFPTQIQIAQALNITDKTVRTLVALLREIELIETEINDPHDNLVYRFIPPIEDEAEFFAKFPLAAEAKRKKDEFWAKEIPEKQARKGRKVSEVPTEIVPNLDDELAELDEYW